jgi:hypothetical protein
LIFKIAEGFNPSNNLHQASVSKRHNVMPYLEICRYVGTLQEKICNSARRWTQPAAFASRPKGKERFPAMSQLSAAGHREGPNNSSTCSEQGIGDSGKKQVSIQVGVA